ncbi:MAG: T9SS type A sorting domain-containing protein [Ignavibacteria bacterium]|nr:T9SS type A sorting domain-containing protein [Ignavibacteria bacterium]
MKQQITHLEKLAEKKLIYVVFILLLIVILVSAFIYFESESKNPLSIGDIKLSAYPLKIHIDTLIPPELNLKSTNGDYGFVECVSKIMDRDKYFKSDFEYKYRTNSKKKVDRTKLEQSTDLVKSSFFSTQEDNSQVQNLGETRVSQKFKAGNLSSSGYIPPDAMGAVGPSQFVYIVNGRIITYNKNTGQPDGIINTTTDNFFNSVKTTGWTTTDPRVRYDRLSGRWIFVMVDMPYTGLGRNRIMIAVSNSSVITSSSTITYFYFQDDTYYLDYPTLAVDKNAVYIGGNLFSTSNGTFQGTRGFVIRKSSILGSGPMVRTTFTFINNPRRQGIFSPQGIDNYDPNSTEGYFIGVDNASFGLLKLRRISNPGGTPTSSNDINISTVLTTYYPLKVPHKGNTGGDLAKIDASDDRLFYAHYRIINGVGGLWTAHNLQVDSNGVAVTNGTRNGIRWYEIRDIESGKTPYVYRAGTIYDSSKTNPLFYFYPAMTINGQGHVIVGFTSAGENQYLTASYSYRLATDPPTKFRTVINYEESQSAYNVPWENYQQRGSRRWGDYSFTSLDPNDDMTIWTIQEYCDSTDSWGCVVAKVLAPTPPPDTLWTPNPPTITAGMPSVIVTINSSVPGFYDPGSGFPNRISASCNHGVTVNSITYNSPTSVTLDLNTQNAQRNSGDNVDIFINVTITNPDGQSVTANNIIKVEGAMPVKLASFTHFVKGRDVKLSWTTTEEINNAGFEIYRKQKESNNWIKIGFVKGNGNSNTPVNYTYNDKNLNKGVYNYKLKQIDYNGNFEFFELNSSVEIGSPVKFSLQQNYPNPFNPITKIGFQISEPTNAKLTIYDITGRAMTILLDKKLDVGYYEVEFNGASLASGIYFYELKTDFFTETKKMLLIK